MAILTVQQYQTLTAQVLTGADLAAATGWCAAVSSAVAAVLKPFSAEPLALANVVLDAPADRDILLPVTPARSVTSVYYRGDAGGLVTNFAVGTSTYLLDNSAGDEYQLLIDDYVNSWARAGVLRRIGAFWGGGSWGGSYIRYPDRLASSLVAERGSVLVNYLAGCTSVPAEVEAAAVHLVTKMMMSRKFGTQVVGASLNGGSYSLPASAVGNLWADPVVAGYLSQYAPGVRIA